jgi:hypothetical protein
MREANFRRSNATRALEPIAISCVNLIAIGARKIR